MIEILHLDVTAREPLIMIYKSKKPTIQCDNHGSHGSWNPGKVLKFLFGVKVLEKQSRSWKNVINNTVFRQTFEDINLISQETEEIWHF